MNQFVLAVALAAGSVRLDVPLVARGDPYCGPAAVAMVLAYDHHAISMEEIETGVYSPGLKGTLAVAITAFLRERHIPFRVTRPGSIADVQRSLADGRPVLALLDHGIAIYQAPHYVVVVGMAGDDLLINSGRRAAQRMRGSAFDAEWRRAGRWMLVLGAPASSQDGASSLR